MATDTFTYNLEKDGRNLIVEVEYTFSPPSKTNKHLLDSDQDYYGWFDVVDVYIVDEESNEQVNDVDISDKAIKDEYFVFQREMQFIEQEGNREDIPYDEGNIW